MKYIKNNLSIFAVIAAAVSAFAFNGLDPEPDPDLKLFANTPSGWEEIEKPPICDQNPSRICVAQFEENDTSTPPIYEEPGNFLGTVGQ